MHKRLRTVVKSSILESQAEELFSDFKRFDEILVAVEFAIAQKAESFPKIDKTIIRVIKTRRAGSMPEFRFYFTIDDDDHCTLWGVETVEEPEEHDE